MSISIINSKNLQRRRERVWTRLAKKGHIKFIFHFQSTMFADCQDMVHFYIKLFRSFLLNYCLSTARNQRMAKSGENIFQIIKNHEQQCNLGWRQEQQEKHHWHLIISLKDVELQVQGIFRKILQWVSSFYYLKS